MATAIENTNKKSQPTLQELYRNSKYPVLFKFSHPYKKLLDAEFTTIRSIKYAKEHDIEIGSMGWVVLVVNEIPIAIAFVQILSWTDKKICDMALKLLQKDVEYGEFTIQSHDEFVATLNELTISSGIPYANNRPTTIKRIFHLKKIAIPEGSQ